MLFRSMMVNGDHYTWNYWEPMGQMDLDLEARKDGGSGMRHWVATHPYRNYQAGEVSQIVEAYHNGLTFDQKDIELIIATNLKVMWNGDKQKPQFVNSNVRLPQVKLTAEEQKAKDEEVAQNAYAKEGRAGMLWTPLMDFDPTIRELYELQLAGGRGAVAEINRAYYQNVTKKRAPSFERHHKDMPVTVYKALPNQAPALTLAAALPYVVEAGKETMLISKSVVDGKLEIALMSADGSKKLTVLHTGEVKGGSDGHAGVFILPWNLQVDGKRLEAGDYRIRWTFGEGYAEYPLTVK